MSYNKMVAAILVIVLIANIVLFAMKKINTYTFWGIMLAIGLYAYRDKVIKLLA